MMKSLIVWIIGLLTSVVVSAKDINVVAGAVFLGTRVEFTEEQRIIDTSGYFQTDFKKFIQNDRYAWTTAASLGVVYWFKADTASQSQSKILLGLGLHMVTSVSDGDNEKFAPAVALHLGKRSGPQVALGLYLAPTNAVDYPNGKDSVVVPSSTAPSDFEFTNSGSKLNFFIGFNFNVSKL